MIKQMGQGVHSVFVNDAQMKRVDRAMTKGKGVKIHLSADEMEHSKMHGKGIWDSIKKGVSTVRGVAHQALQNPVIRSIAKEAVSKGAEMAGRLAAAKLGPAGGEITKELLNQGGNAVIGGVGVKHKARMAKVRAAKKKGKGFGGDIGGFLGHYGGDALDRITGIGAVHHDVVKGGGFFGDIGSIAGNALGNYAQQRLGGGIEATRHPRFYSHYRPSQIGDTKSNITPLHSQAMNPFQSQKPRVGGLGVNTYGKYTHGQGLY